MSRIVVYKASLIDDGVRVENSDGFTITSTDGEQLLKEVINSMPSDKIAVVWDTKRDFWDAIYKLLPEVVQGDLNSGRASSYKRMRLWWGITRWGRTIGMRADFRENIRDNFYNEVRKEINIGELKQYYDWIKDDQSIEQVVELGNNILNTLDKMGLQPSNLTSAISIFKENVLDKLDIATVFNMPDDTLDLQEMAYNCCDEMDFTIKTPDNNKPVYDYDVTNAYGSALAELPDIRDADIIHSDEIPVGCTWGVFHAKIHNKTPISPLYNPETQSEYMGYWEGFMPIDLYACVLNWDIGDIEVKDGWYIFVKNNNKPFEGIMRNLYNLRNDDKLQNNLAKAMSVATWGKMLEERDTQGGKEYGKLFCPIYASMVVNKMKVKVTDFIYKNNLQNDIVQVRVDGIKTYKDMPIQTERKFGEWRKVV